MTRARSMPSRGLMKSKVSPGYGSPAPGRATVSTRTDLSRASPRPRGSAHASPGAAQAFPWRRSSAAMPTRPATATTTDAACLYDGHVMHARLRPVAHRFRYRVVSLLIDLDRLDEA